MMPSDLPECLKKMPLTEFQGLGYLIRLTGRDRAIDLLKEKRPVREATRLVEAYLRYFDEPVAIAPV